MPALPKEIVEFMQKWDVATSEVWAVPGGKAYAVKHSALERIAATTGFVFDMPDIIEAKTEERIVTVLVRAHDPATKASVWSFGEASPANNKNAYCWSMAEKRAKDRCILKLLSIHGILYSEDEMKDAGEPPAQEPVEAEAEELIPVEQDVDRKSAYFIKKNRPNDWPEVVAKFRAAKTRGELKTIAGSKYVEELTKDWPQGFLDELRAEYTSCAKALPASLQAAE